MSNPAVVQVQSYFASGSYPSNDANFSAVLDNFVGGHGVCVVVETMSGGQAYSVIDNNGNTYTLVPNTSAAISGGPSISIWFCASANVNPSTLVLAITAEFNVGVSNATVTAYEISGIGSGGIAAAISAAFPTGAVTSLSLAGGSGALYITGISGLSDYAASIPSPWTVDSDSGQDGSFAIAASGTTTASFLWTPANQSNNNPQAVAGVAISSVASGGGGTVEPFTRNDADAHDGLTVTFLVACPHGLIGETKKISASAARELVANNLASLVY